MTAIEDSVNCLTLPMLDSGRSRAGAPRRVAAIIASMLAVVLSFVFVLRTTSDAVLLPPDPGPVGASVESGDFDSLPFGKLVEEVVGEEAGEKNESESKDLEVAALSLLDFEALALVGRLVGEWERPSQNRARARLGVVGARGPPIG